MRPVFSEAVREFGAWRSRLPAKPPIRIREENPTRKPPYPPKSHRAPGKKPSAELFYLRIVGEKTSVRRSRRFFVRLNQSVAWSPGVAVAPLGGLGSD